MSLKEGDPIVWFKFRGGTYLRIQAKFIRLIEKASPRSVERKVLIETQDGAIKRVPLGAVQRVVQ